MAKQFENLSAPGGYSSIEAKVTSVMGDKSAGDYMEINGTPGFLLIDAKVDDTAVVIVSSSRVKVEKVTNASVNPGQAVYWNKTSNKLTTVSAGGVYVGIGHRTAENVDTHAFIVFDGRFTKN